eukprot:318369_1
MFTKILFLLLIVYYGKSQTDYVFESPGLSFWNANAYCSFRHGTFLATINSAEQNTDAIGSNNPAWSAWIGLNDVNNENIYVWINGEAPSYTNWDSTSGAPNGGTAQNCVKIVLATTTWEDVDCAQTFKYICAYPESFMIINDEAKHIRSLPLTTTTTIGTMDILDEIIINFDFKLTSSTGLANEDLSLLVVGAAGADSRYPGIWINEASKQLKIIFFNTSAEYTLDSIALNAVYRFEFYANQKSLSVALNGTKLIQKDNLLSHTILYDKTIYLKHPSYDTINGQIWNLKIQNSNSYIQPFNYLCD